IRPKAHRRVVDGWTSSYLPESGLEDVRTSIDQLRLNGLEFLHKRSHSTNRLESATGPYPIYGRRTNTVSFDLGLARAVGGGNLISGGLCWTPVQGLSRPF